jgi:phenylacetate-coenzyme A ligase PaaK-like adenylate-forming protein
MTGDLKNRIFSVKTENDFLETALQVFDCHVNKNAVYQRFTKVLGRGLKSVGSLTELPFMPIEFFKKHIIITGDMPVQKIFESSGTTGASTSRHYVTDIDIYRESFLRSFRIFYGDPSEYMIAALLPSYTERDNSSLVFMADELIKQSGSDLSGFYLEKDDSLISNILKCRSEGLKVILLGVTFALLDLADKGTADLSGVVIMETGGMKGRRPEITREALHSALKNTFNIQSVHSEYGMTELLSQAYSKGDGIFYCPPWMKIILRDTQDPLTLFTEPGRTGGINIIDLANLNSCSFISTGDLGRIHPDGGFEVLGRSDNSDIRGCNLLVENL